METLKLGPPTKVDFVTSDVLSRRDQALLQKHWRVQRESMTAGIAAALDGNARGKRLCIIGAGNATDLNLPELLCDGPAQVDLLDLGAASSHKALREAQKMSPRWQGEGRVIDMDASLMMTDLMQRMDGLPHDPAFRGMPIRCPDDFLPLIGGIRQAIAEAMQTVHVPSILNGAYDAVISDCILSQLMVCVEQKTDQILGEIFGQRTDNRLAGPPSGTEFLDFSRGEMAQWLIANQMQVMTQMLAPGGKIFFASDHCTLVHTPNGRVERPRIRGDLTEMVGQEAAPMRIISRSDWEWNRQPHELHRGKGYPYETEQVTGLLLAQ